MCRHMLTDVDISRVVSTNLEKSRHISRSVDISWHVSTHLDIFRHISSYIGIYQHRLAHLLPLDACQTYVCSVIWLCNVSSVLSELFRTCVPVSQFKRGSKWNRWDKKGSNLRHKTARNTKKVLNSLTRSLKLSLLLSQPFCCHLLCPRRPLHAGIADNNE